MAKKYIKFGQNPEKMTESHEIENSIVNKERVRPAGKMRTERAQKRAGTSCHLHAGAAAFFFR